MYPFFKCFYIIRKFEKKEKINLYLKTHYLLSPIPARTRIRTTWSRRASGTSSPWNRHRRTRRSRAGTRWCWRCWRTTRVVRSSTSSPARTIRRRSAGWTLSRRLSLPASARRCTNPGTVRKWWRCTRTPQGRGTSSPCSQVGLAERFFACFYVEEEACFYILNRF